MAAKAPGAGYVWLPEITVAFHQLQGKEIKFKQRGGPKPHQLSHKLGSTSESSVGHDRGDPN